MKTLQLLLVTALFGIFILDACTNHTDINKTKSTFYIVQPAEHFPGFNGHLNWYGRKRAGELMHFLKDSSVERIYVNAFSRAIETGDSLQNLQKTDTVNYPMGAVADSIYKLLKERKDFGRKVLIISLPKDIDKIAEKLGATVSKVSLKDQFNVIYLLVNDHGKAEIRIQKYGNKPMPVQDSVREEVPSP